MNLADRPVRHTILRVDELEALERNRRLNLLKLRGLCDQLHEFEAGIAKWGAILADPSMHEKHSLALRALDVATRGKLTVDAAIHQSLKASDLLDKKEEILRKLETLTS